MATPEPVVRDSQLTALITGPNGLNSRLKASAVNAANGVAGLDANAKLSPSRLNVAADVATMLGATSISDIRSKIGAGTSNVVIGSSAGQAADAKVVNDALALRPTATDVGASLAGKLDVSQVGVAGGVARLNATGQVVDSSGAPVTGGGGVGAPTISTDVDGVPYVDVDTGTSSIAVDVDGVYYIA